MHVLVPPVVPASVMELCVCVVGSGCVWLCALDLAVFQLRQIPAYVCQDTFVFHNKSATASAHIREAMLKNKLQVNKKGQLPGQQS